MTDPNPKPAKGPASSGRTRTAPPQPITPPEPAEPVDLPTIPIRVGPIIIKFLLLIYLISIPMLAYWYFMRPVRADQFKDAQTKWRAMATQFHIPVPKDERWGW